MDVLSDEAWPAIFKEKPEVFTREAKREWLDKLTGVSLGSDAFFPFGANIERAHRSGAVSYTHLDVYKRQPLGDKKILGETDRPPRRRDQTLVYTYFLRLTRNPGTKMAFPAGNRKPATLLVKSVNRGADRNKVIRMVPVTRSRDSGRVSTFFNSGVPFRQE